MDTDTKILHANLQAWLELMSPLLDPIKQYTWTDSRRLEQYWEFLRRGIIIRQYEALWALVKMSHAGVGHFGVTLLRPAFEELI